MDIRTKYFTYNPGAEAAPGSLLAITAHRGRGRNLGGQSQYTWHLEGGTFHGLDRLLVVYLVSSCQLYVFPPGGTNQDPLEVVTTHSEEEGLAALGFTVELY